MGKTNADIWSDQGSTTKTIVDATRFLRYDSASNTFYLSTGTALKAYLDSEGYMNDADFTDDESLQWKNASGTVENKLIKEFRDIYPSGYIYANGFDFVYTGGNQRLSVAYDDIRCVSSSELIDVEAGLQKYLNIAFSVGAGNGCLDTGTFSENRLYYIYGIYNSTTNASDILSSLSNSSPTMPTDYDRYRLIGAVYYIDYVTEQFIQYYHTDFDENNNLIPKIPHNYIEDQAEITISGATVLFTKVHSIDSTNVYEMFMPQQMIKTFSSTFTAGDSGHMLDAGAVADDSLYYLYQILNTSTGAVDFLMSLSASAATMPSGYTVSRIIGYMLTADYSGNSEFWVWKNGDIPYIEMDGTSATRDLTLPVISTFNDLFEYRIKCVDDTNACTIVTTDGFDSGITSPITMITNEVVVVRANRTEYNILQQGVLGDFRNITTVAAATYNILANDSILHVTYTITGAVTSLTLTTGQTIRNRIITINDGGNNATANNITIDTQASQTIDGSATYVISTDGDSVSLYCDGTNWFTF